MGLNKSFSQIRSSILSREPIISVNEVYVIVAEEKSQRTLGVVDGKMDALTLLAGSSVI